MASIDYLAGVIKEVSSAEVVAWFGRDFDGFALVRGSHGYRQCWAAEGIRVYFDGSAGMGVYYQLSGQGCAVVSASRYFKSWGSYVSALRELGSSFNRLDIAFDDTSGGFMFEEVARQIDAGEYTSKYRTVKVSDSMQEGAYTGRVRYLGAMESDSSLCVYDKRLERLARGHADPGAWVRFELRFKGKQAASFASWLEENGDLAGSEAFLRGVVEFRDASSDTNMARCSVSPWWLQFLEECGKMRMTVAVPSRTLEQQAARFVKQHSATLAMLVFCLCNGRLHGKWLDDLLMTGWARMGVKHCAMVRAELGHMPGSGPILGS